MVNSISTINHAVSTVYMYTARPLPLDAGAPSELRRWPRLFHASTRARTGESTVGTGTG
jgi:hypothetical protein